MRDLIIMLLRIMGQFLPIVVFFRMADNVLLDGVRNISDLMVMPGLINLDFADVQSVCI